MIEERKTRKGTHTLFTKRQNFGINYKVTDITGRL